MTTTIVNVSVKHLRPAYQNLKEWMEDPQNVYVGRPGPFIEGKRYPSRASRFANPFHIGKDGDRQEVINKYRIWLDAQLRSGRITAEDLAALHGKRLGCWCAPEPCHAQVLLEYADSMK
jgi:hypothetical protein